jgi:hypothetical protein
MIGERSWRSRTIWTACCALALLLTAGCSKGPKRVPAGGTVEFEDGQPLQGGVLFFNPDESKGNTARVSCSSPVRNGRFELQTLGVERTDSGPGVPLGWYKVQVRVNLPGEVPVFPGQPAIDINPIYLDAEKTPIAIEVVENPEPGQYDIKLKK